MIFRRARALMRSAERRTGLRKWGDDEFLPRLEVWLQSVARDRYLSAVGQTNVATLALRYAVNRLRLEDLIHRHPEVLLEPVIAPIFVTGLPRSGTTALVTLLASHDRLRCLPLWEAADPCSSAPLGLKRQRAQQIRDAGTSIMPTLPNYHDCKPDDLADDQELQGLAFGSYMLEWQAHVPAWRDYYLQEDQTRVYRYLRRVMQALSFQRGGGRWIIKCPQHVEQLPALASVFPDALLVVTHRQRKSVDASMRRMTEYIGRHTRLRAMPSSYWPERFDVMESRYSSDCHLFPDRIELELEEWRRDPVAVRSLICGRANLQP